MYSQLVFSRRPSWHTVMALVALLAACPDANEHTLDAGASVDAYSAHDAQVAADRGSSDGAAIDNAAFDSASSADTTSATDTTSSSAECDNMATLHPSWLWCDGFESGQALGEVYPDIGSTGLTVDTQDAFEGTHAMRQHYDEGQVNAGWIFFFYADALGRDYGPIHDEIYARWYHKFAPGFIGLPPKMARISSIGPGFDKRFAVHHWIADDGTVVADVSAPYSSQANSSGWLPLARSSFSYADAANIGRWVCHEMSVKVNTPGQADGAYRFWADDQLILERANVDLRGDTDYNYNAVQLDAYWNDGSPAAQNRYYDNFVVSTERIGCR